MALFIYYYGNYGINCSIIIKYYSLLEWFSFVFFSHLYNATYLGRSIHCMGVAALIAATSSRLKLMDIVFKGRVCQF